MSRLASDPLLPDLSPHPPAIPNRSRHTITVLFGSHPKEYRFSVARIALEDDHCTILSEANGDRYHTDKIKVPRCHRADEVH